jgi:hypothetical protein
MLIELLEDDCRRGEDWREEIELGSMLTALLEVDCTIGGIDIELGSMLTIEPEPVLTILLEGDCKTERVDPRTVLLTLPEGDCKTGAIDVELVSMLLALSEDDCFENWFGDWRGIPVEIPLFEDWMSVEDPALKTGDGGITALVDEMSKPIKQEQALETLLGDPWHSHSQTGSSVANGFCVVVYVSQKDESRGADLKNSWRQSSWWRGSEESNAKSASNGKGEHMGARHMKGVSSKVEQLELVWMPRCTWDS